MNEEKKHPLQARAAQLVIDKARTALEHALPRGCNYVVILNAPGFNTVASNLPKADQLELAQGCVRQLSSDVFQGLT